MTTLRPCTHADFSDVLRLLQQLWPNQRFDQARLQEIFERALTSDAQRLICAVDDGRLIGFCSLTLKNNLWQQGYLGHIDELVVDETCRGRGIGTQLLNAIVEIAKKCGCRRVELDSAFHRQAAHKFYEREGFENRAYLFSKKL